MVEHGNAKIEEIITALTFTTKPDNLNWLTQRIFRKHFGDISSLIKKNWKM